MEQEVKTENEQKKEYLRSYKDHVRRVNRISEEIKELREMMMSTKAINYDACLMDPEAGRSVRRGGTYPGID